MYPRLAPPWSHSASMSRVLGHSCVPWDPCCCSSVFWLTAEGALCSHTGEAFLSCTSTSVDYLELRLFLFVHQICLPLLIPRWWSSQPTLWVVLNPTFVPCKAMWTCSELLSQLSDITVNMLSCLLHLNQVKALFQIQTMVPIISIVAIAGC